MLRQVIVYVTLHLNVVSCPMDTMVICMIILQYGVLKFWRRFCQVFVILSCLSSHEYYVKFSSPCSSVGSNECLVKPLSECSSRSFVECFLKFLSCSSVGSDGSFLKNCLNALLDGLISFRPSYRHSVRPSVLMHVLPVLSQCSSKMSDLNTLRSRFYYEF